MTPTPAIISANSYVWGYNFVLPNAAVASLQDGGTFPELLGAIPPELEPVSQVVEAYLEDDLASVRAVDEGAGVYLTATWAAPEVLVPTAVGWEFITSWLPDSGGSSLVLDVAGASTEPGTPLHIWTYKSSDNADQQWTYASDGWIINAESGLYVEIADSDPSDGATIQINHFTGAPNQSWSICGDGFIRSRMNGNVLDVSGGSNSPGTPIISYHPKYPPTQSPGNQGWTMNFAPTLSCNGLVTVISNDSPNDLLITLSPSDGTLLTYPDSPVQLVPPNSVGTYVSTYNTDNEVTFAILDLAISPTNPVVSFEVHQHYCLYEAGTVWADSYHMGNGYTLNCQPNDWYGGAYSQVPGIIVASVTGG
ncbi:RICIN domain-containing protein [Streptomyces pathocidini]|uniref:RICIN domain-containing protein n=1 Tax=Streptomyces pathocidini TaxID=1650571 RepID=UPI0033FE6E27